MQYLLNLVKQMNIDLDKHTYFHKSHVLVRWVNADKDVVSEKLPYSFKTFFDHIKVFQNTLLYYWYFLKAVFYVYGLMSLEINVHLWNYHHKLCYETYPLPQKVFWLYLLPLFCICACVCEIRTLNIRSTFF